MIKTECKKYEKYMTEGSNSDLNHRIYRFPNDRGASVIYGFGSYGLELMPISFDGEDYECDQEPLGYLTPEKLEEALDKLFTGEEVTS